MERETERQGQNVTIRMPGCTVSIRSAGSMCALPAEGRLHSSRESVASMVGSVSPVLMGGGMPGESALRRSGEQDKLQDRGGNQNRGQHHGGIAVRSQ